MNLPNKLTLARCFMAGAFVAIMSVKSVYSYSLAYVLFTAAIITDYYDGKIARERDLVTNFGKLFDPVADKVLMLAALIMMMTIPELWIPGWTLVAIFSREFLVTGARAMAAVEGEVIAASEYGKAKTVMQMVYVMVFLFLAILLEFIDSHHALALWLPGGPAPYKYYVGFSSRVAIVLVALYTAFSGLHFARANWKLLDLNNAS
jgi:CDP-diacylglycerol--glycerol-3-phosphate 3-phosphatidyltransferase